MFHRERDYTAGGKDTSLCRFLKSTSRHATGRGRSEVSWKLLRLLRGGLTAAGLVVALALPAAGRAEQPMAAGQLLPVAAQVPQPAGPEPIWPAGCGIPGADGKDYVCGPSGRRELILNGFNPAETGGAFQLHFCEHDKYNECPPGGCAGKCCSPDGPPPPAVDGADPLALAFARVADMQDDDVRPGWVGRYRPAPKDLSGGNIFPIEDRWRLGFPVWDRTAYGSPLNPYYQNVLKGDYPIFEHDPDDIGTFFTIQATNNAFYEARQLTVKGGDVNQRVYKDDVFVELDLFRGDNTFHPSDWFVRITPAFDITRVTGNPANADFQVLEGFVDKQIAILSDYYDTVDVRVGRQVFNADFAGFLFVDNNDAVRLFGTYESNRIQYNLYAFNIQQHNAVSAFTEFDPRDQGIFGGNIFYQDFIFPGFNVEANILYDADRFENHVNATYLELAGNGHIGRFIVNTAFIEELGTDDDNPIAKKEVNINAQLAALELDYQIDWIFPKVSILYASGDKNVNSKTATGFDAPFDNPNFAGGGFAYLDRENVTPGGVILANAFSFLPNLRAKATDPVNAVNPGLLLLNTGFNANLTARLTAFFNVNYYLLNDTDPVNVKAEQLFKKPVIVGKDEGGEVSLGLVYEPLMITNMVFTFGGAAFEPGNAIKDLNGGNGETLFTLFAAFTLIY